MVLAATVALYESHEPFRDFCDNTYDKLHAFADQHGFRIPFAQQEAEPRQRQPMSMGSQSAPGDARREWVPLRKRRPGWDRGRGEESEGPLDMPAGSGTGVDADAPGDDAVRRRKVNAGAVDHGASPMAPNPLEMNPTHPPTSEATPLPALSAEAVASLPDLPASQWHLATGDNASIGASSGPGVLTPAGSEWQEMDTRSDTTETLSQPRTLDGMEVLGSWAGDDSDGVAWDRDDVSVASSWSEVGSEVSLESGQGTSRR